jgi:hypothetical protein
MGRCLFNILNHLIPHRLRHVHPSTIDLISMFGPYQHSIQFKYKLFFTGVQIFFLDQVQRIMAPIH